jgi:HlyD family secretion protein
MVNRFGVSWRRWVIACVATVTAAAVAYGVVRGMAAANGAVPVPEVPTSKEAGISVEVVVPARGGIAKLCTQPGSVEPFESADLYAKVSGFLAEQSVDIGYPVREGDVLARIWVPEYEKQIQQDAADVARTEAKSLQAKAAIDTATADLGAATAGVALAQAETKSKASYRAFREKQRDRIRELAAREAIDAKLRDEQEDQYQSAVAAELAATEAVAAAVQKVAAARARVKQSQADLTFAEAEIASARARLEKSKVLLDYSVIKSPYTGVVTKRNFFRGDFIRSADAGGDRVPLLSVERTDIMRVVVQVPERDVPFVDLGDPATIEVDALPGRVFKSRGADKVEVSRLAASEEASFRMMRTEVHVKNPDNKLRRGMFGRVTIVLEPGSPSSYRIPSAALTGKADAGQGSIYVVRDGRARLVPVQYGTDNGSEVEIRSGLAANDRVIVRASGVINDGTLVERSDSEQIAAGN